MSVRAVPKPTCAHCGVRPVHQKRHQYCSVQCSRIAVSRRPKPGCIWRKAKVTESGCWQWTGHLTRDGYGSQHPHRTAYEEFVGPIPDGLQIDHLCRNRACCNPEHLEAVTPRQNTHRGYGPAGLNARKTHCDKGHALTVENTYVHPPTSPRAGRRTCRECLRASWRKYDSEHPGKRGRRVA